MSADRIGRGTSTYWQGCGFNAHGQVTGHASNNERAAVELRDISGLTGRSTILLAKWAYTIDLSAMIVWLDTPNELHIYGAMRGISVRSTTIRAEGFTPGQEWACGLRPFGTDLEPLGAITQSGQLLIYESAPEPTFKLVSPSAKAAEHRAIEVAVLYDGRVALMVHNDPLRSVVYEAKDFATLIAWYEGRTHDHASISARVFKTRLVGLTGGATAFVAWDVKGDVYTWGVAQYQAALGRVPSDDSPASEPGIVTYLHGICINLVQTQGTIYVALSSDTGALYIWGSTSPTADPADDHGTFSLLNIVDNDGVVDLVPFDKDVADLALGLSHMVLVTTNRELYAIGDNRHRQLPCAIAEGEPAIVRDWRHCGAGATAVECGPLTTFVKHGI